MTDEQPQPGGSVPEATQVQLPVAAAEDQPAMAAITTPPATGQAAPAPSKRRRAMGGAGQVVGIVGLVLSLVLAVGALVGTAWVTGQIDDVAAGVDSRLEAGQPMLDTVSAQVTEIKSVVDEVVTAADAAAAAAAPADGLLSGLQDRLNNLSTRYANLRNAYGDLREKIAGGIAGLETLDRLIPGFDVPQGPIDALQALDARIQELDASISGVLDTRFDGSTLRDAAAAVSEKVGRVSAGLDTVLGVIDQAGVKLAQARTDIANAAATITSLLTIAGVVIAVLFVYIGFLHWVLFRTSRAVHRGA